jgi:hypothetical protein
MDLDPQTYRARWVDRRKAGAIDVDVSVESPARLDAALQVAAGPAQARALGQRHPDRLLQVGGKHA